MARTPSTMLPLGTPAPDFALPDPEGQAHKLRDFDRQPALLVMFICNHCPFVKHVRSELARLGRDYPRERLAIVAISPNDIDAYPADRPELMAAEARAAGRRLVYRGQLDDSRPGNDIPVSGRDLRGAIDAVLSDQTLPEEQRPSLGCNIKWRPGNEPEYYGVSVK